LTVLASLADGTVVGAQQGNAIGISFHPEVSGETKIHEYFLGVVEAFLSSTER
jgi:5'-phosphate synthase pdxT subunit